MGAFFGSVCKRMFGISAREVSFERRGFRGNDPSMRERLQGIGQAFVWGYHAAIEMNAPLPLVPRLNSLDLDMQGFAFEGPGDGLALLDFITPWRRDRVSSFLDGAGGAHAYMVHVGVGWLLARIPGRIAPRLAQFDPWLR